MHFGFLKKKEICSLRDFFTTYLVMISTFKRIKDTKLYIHNIFITFFLTNFR